MLCKVSLITLSVADHGMTLTVPILLGKGYFGGVDGPASGPSRNWVPRMSSQPYL